MPVIKEFVDLLEKSKAIHKLKNDDYANDSNPFENFDVQAYFINLFKQCAPQHQAFASIVGLKISRLSQLLPEDKTPNNESLDDTFLDLLTYVGLWGAWFECNKIFDKKVMGENPYLPSSYKSRLENQVKHDPGPGTNSPIDDIPF